MEEDNSDGMTIFGPRARQDVASKYGFISWGCFIEREDIIIGSDKGGLNDYLRVASCSPYTWFQVHRLVISTERRPGSCLPFGFMSYIAASNRDRMKWQFDWTYMSVKHK